MTYFKGYFTLKQKTYKSSVNGFVPKTVVIPLAQDSETECECLVKPGDTVTEGQLIASSLIKKNKFNTNIYSSVPGVVQGYELSPVPDGRYCKSLKIKTGGSFSYLGKKKVDVDWKLLTSLTLTKTIADKGVINTFNTSSPSPLAEQIEKISKNKNRLLVVRLFDDDSTRIVDTVTSRLFLEHILEGSEIVAKALDADAIVFVCDKNFARKNEINSSIKHIVVTTNTELFPNGFYEQIIKTVRKNSTEKLFSNISKKDLFVDATTLNEVYRTVKHDMPVIDRYVHVSGSCLPTSGLVKVCVGTTLRFLVEQFGGFVKQPAAIIVNGLVLGFSATSLDAPITKYVKSVIFLPVLRRPVQHNSECIRCGNCRRACPLGLSPDILYQHASGGQQVATEYLKTAAICSNCGLCNLYCPSRLPVSQRIAELKEKTSGSED